MNTRELSAAYRRLSDALDKIEPVALGKSKPMLDGDYAVGAALLWSFLRDLFTTSSKDIFTRDEILILLEILSRDPEFAVAGTFEFVANLTEEEEAQ